jgi:hypothetical protein
MEEGPIHETDLEASKIKMSKPRNTKEDGELFQVTGSKEMSAKCSMTQGP